MQRVCILNYVHEGLRLFSWGRRFGAQTCLSTSVRTYADEGTGFADADT